MTTKSALKVGAYNVYSRLVPYPLLRLRDVNIRDDWEGIQLVQLVSTMLTAPGPTYLGRIGGCEFDASNAYFNDPARFADPNVHGPHLARVMELAGYFDFDHDYGNFVRFLEGQIEAYRGSDNLIYCNKALVTKFERNVFFPGDMKLLRHVCTGKTLINYAFLEGAMPFLRSFKTWGEGKRILVVSPFSQSLEFQYQRKNDLIADYTFPDFELLTYKSPVTWSTMEDTQETMGLTTNNWHEELARMNEGISKLDFDIAFLSCGSYAAQTGHFIRHEMGRSAVYTAGSLNLLFNIYGKRFGTPPYSRPDTQIDAFENDEVARLKGGRTFPNEAMGAYFGKRDGGPEQQDTP